MLHLKKHVQENPVEDVRSKLQAHNNLFVALKMYKYQLKACWI